LRRADRASGIPRWVAACVPLAASWPLLAQEPLPVDDAGVTSSAHDAVPASEAARDVAAPNLEDLLADIAPLPASTEAEAAATEAEAADSGIGNEDVIAMVRAEFSESTIIAAIQANDTRFDVSPRALVELKEAGVPESVIEAMLAATTAKRQASAEAAPPSPQGSASTAQQTVVVTTAWPAAAQTRLPGAAPQSAAGPTVWLVDGDTKVPLEPTAALMSPANGRRGPLKTLKDLAGGALRFAHPALGAAGLFGLIGAFDREVTVVWALAGSTSSRKLDGDVVFEVMYDGLPGVNPDEYLPKLVELVPTDDNLRLVGAAKMSMTRAGMVNGPITEEAVKAELRQLGRGHYEVALTSPLPPGEYALVLRPTTESRSRGRRRKGDAPDSITNARATEFLYLTWDFSIGS